ncbi:MAG: DUF885 domain-containing protein [wastewater metagenome]|nr:DUF885 domain-containing protein [Candidatus Loosdrechtia aerotolerans]
MKNKYLLFLFISLFQSIVFLQTSQALEGFEQQVHSLLENKEGQNDTQLLYQVFDLYTKWKISSYPEFATLYGYPGQNDRWTDYSLEAIARREEQIVLFSHLLQKIEKSRLRKADQLNYDLFKTNITMEVEGNRFKTEYMPISQIDGIQIQVPQVLKTMSTATVEDYHALLARFRHIPQFVDEIIALLNCGLKERITIPKVVIVYVPQQILNLISGDPLKNRMMHAFKRFPNTISPSVQDQIRREAAKVFSREFIPAFQKLHDYLVRTYIPQTRQTIGLSELPHGKDWYRFNIYRYTTTGLSPEEIHEFGLREVKRIRQEMDKLIAQMNFDGSFSDFIRFLCNDAQFFFANKNDLLVAYRDIAKRADPELMRLFGKLPRLPYGIKPVPSYKEKSQPAAYYEPGSYNTHRPGYFFVNTYNLKNRPKWEMEVLTMHEAVPGHHLQISLALELQDVPEFRKYSNYTAFVEGWGLYAEDLGDEMGFYKDPYSKFGQLTFEMWRAVRLVVDTGIHAMDWSRQQAITFFQEHTTLADHDIIVEVDRYIAMPGQALSYKIGELKIKELRTYSEKALGDMFNIRAFHDVLLCNGSLPLEILEMNIKEWVEKQKHER